MRRCDEVTAAILGGKWIPDQKKYVRMTYIDLFVNNRLAGFIGTYNPDVGQYLAHRKFQGSRESRAFDSKEEAMAWVEESA